MPPNPGEAAPRACRLFPAVRADTRLPSTFAHEAGYFVGDMDHKGTATKLLMRGEGSGYKIPFALAKHFREPLANRAVQ